MKRVFNSLVQRPLPSWHIQWWVQYMIFVAVFLAIAIIAMWILFKTHPELFDETKREKNVKQKSKFQPYGDSLEIRSKILGPKIKRIVLSFGGLVFLAIGLFAMVLSFAGIWGGIQMIMPVVLKHSYDSLIVSSGITKIFWQLVPVGIFCWGSVFTLYVPVGIIVTSWGFFQNPGQLETKDSEYVDVTIRDFMKERNHGN